jgi:type II secretory pathway pseudopilin PulG
MVVMLIVLVALGTIAGLTVISVQGGTATASAQRFSAMALYAAESGAAATMAWLRTVYDEGTKWSAWVDPNNQPGQSPTDIPGNGSQPGMSGNLLSRDQQGWYEVRLLNNRTDPGLGLGDDADGVIIIQVTGHGPNGAMRRIEWEVEKPYKNDGTPLPGLALRGWRDLF